MPATPTSPALTTSTIARLAVGVRDAKDALGEAFLKFPDRGVAALFDLCPGDAEVVRELGRAMHSGWFSSAAGQLAKGEPISEGSLARSDQWIAKVFNYAYGLKGLASEAPPASTAAAPEKTANLRVIAFAGAAAAILAIVFVAVLFGHGSPAPSNLPPKAVAALASPATQIPPQRTHPQPTFPRQTDQPKPVQETPRTAPPEQPKPESVVTREPAPKRRRNPVHESHRRIRTAPHHAAPIASEPKVSVVHETPPPN